MPIQHPIFEDEQLKTYFNTLPMSVQQAVIESGVSIQTVEDLHKFAEGYTTK